MTKYLWFRNETPEKAKTAKLAVVARRSNETLGMIKWFGRWRQYAFFPVAGTVWNPECLDAVNEKIRALMAERKAMS